MRLLTIIGTRPNLIKEYLIHRNAKDYNIDEILLHTGQHYDLNMSKIFEDDFTIKVDYNLNIGSKSHGSQTGRMIEKIEEIIFKEEPDATLVYGDVNSSLAGALASVKCHVPVIHYEGGIRTKLHFNPEEINRRVSDTVSELVFCVTKNDVENLKEENYPEEKIVNSGDLHNDLLELTKKKHNIRCTDEGYVVCTFHRAETTDNERNLVTVVKSILKSSQNFIIPLHPRTKKILERIGYLDKLTQAANVEIRDPLGYVDFIKLLAGASKVLTDSGGVRRESFLLRKPVINFSNIIWFREIIDAGYKFIANYEEDKILEGLNNFKPDTDKYYNIFGNGDAHKIILEEISKRFG